MYNLKDLMDKLDEVNMVYSYEEWTDDYGETYHSILIPQQRYRFAEDKETLLDADVY